MTTSNTRTAATTDAATAATTNVATDPVPTTSGDTDHPLKARLAQKDAVIAEVTEELVKVKKSAGEP